MRTCKIFLINLILVFFSFELSLASDHCSAEPVVKEFLQDAATFFPEDISDMGDKRVAENIGVVSVDLDDKIMSFYLMWQDKIKEIKSKQTFSEQGDTLLNRLDEFLSRSCQTMQLKLDRHVVPLGTPSFQQGIELFGAQRIFIHLLSLKMQNMDQAMLELFKKYVVVDYLALQRKYIAHYLQTKSDSFTHLIYPSKFLLETYLSNRDIYLSETQSLLESADPGNSNLWRSYFDEYKKQVQRFDNFLENTLLPKASIDPITKTVPELYLQYLSSYSLSQASPKDMIRVGQNDFNKLFDVYKKLGEQIAKSESLNASDLPTVFSFLDAKTKNQSQKTEDVLANYRKIAQQLSSILKENKLINDISMSEVRIRAATPAETKMLPAPFLYPPRILAEASANNVPEIVIPSKDGIMPYSDFVYYLSAFALMAHEGRPGHGLQLNYMLSQSSPLHSIFVSLSQIEGWGLYAEDIIYPYVEPEIQFYLIRMRLLRMARYFLDPGVQIGVFTQDDVIEILHNRLGFSKEFSVVEYNQYAYLMPGQATSYYSGYLAIKKAKEAATVSEYSFNSSMLQVVSGFSQLVER